MALFRYGEKENHPRGFPVVFETGNYKYFVDVCRAFLKFGEEKIRENRKIVFGVLVFST